MKTVISCGNDGIRIWDLATARLLRTQSEHIGTVWAVAVTPNNKAILSGNDDGSVIVWDFGGASTAGWSVTPTHFVNALLIAAEAANHAAITKAARRRLSAIEHKA
jgi:WD40 repeat protein